MDVAASINSTIIRHFSQGDIMTLNIPSVGIEPIFSILIGILILLVPRFLNYFVAAYLIIIGILGVMR